MLQSLNIRQFGRAVVEWLVFSRHEKGRTDDLPVIVFSYKFNLVTRWAAWHVIRELKHTLIDRSWCTRSIYRLDDQSQRAAQSFPTRPQTSSELPACLQGATQSVAASL